MLASFSYFLPANKNPVSARVCFTASPLPVEVIVIPTRLSPSCCTFPLRTCKLVSYLLYLSSRKAERNLLKNVPQLPFSGSHATLSQHSAAQSTTKQQVLVTREQREGKGRKDSRVFLAAKFLVNTLPYYASLTTKEDQSFAGCFSLSIQVALLALLTI